MGAKRASFEDFVVRAQSQTHAASGWRWGVIGGRGKEA